MAKIVMMETHLGKIELIIWNGSKGSPSTVSHFTDEESRPRNCGFPEVNCEPLVAKEKEQ